MATIPPPFAAGALSVALLFASAGSPLAAERLFSAQVPFSVDELPPGQFRNALNNLAPPARQRAMSWLTGFTFPAQDAAQLHVDRDGGIFYADTVLPETVDTALTDPGTAAITATDPNTVFALHSKPGASRLVYLDFDGHLIAGTAWNSDYSELAAKAFDTDGNPTVFGAAERAAIAEIWHRVAEDYAPYDIDVTTQDPTTLGISFGPLVARVLITTDSDQLGRAMPAAGAGGVAYVNVWGRNDYSSYYSPALVYYNNLLNGTTYIAEAAAHELGHNLGLGHDGTATQGYFAGLGADSSPVSWAPIMGVGYYKNVTQWSKGEYDGASNSQDDLAVIDGKLGYRSDDHGDSYATASLLVTDGEGNLSASNPETDAYNEQPANKGIIGRNGSGVAAQADTDMFYVDSGSGVLTLTITPAWDAFYRTLRRGANLDIRATLSDQNGNLVATSDPLSETAATISVAVTQGRYYLALAGMGNDLTPYSAYASLGQYFISGFVPPSGTIQNSPPNAAFSALCDGLSCALSDQSSDADGYIAERLWSFGDGTTSTLQQPNHTFAAAGSYSVVLTVTDDGGQQASTTQLLTLTDPLAVAPEMPDALQAANNGDGTATLSWAAQSAATQYELQRQSRNPKNGKWTATTLIATIAAPNTSADDAAGSGTFRYGVRALNAYGASAWSPWQEVAVTGGSGGGGAGGGKCNPRKQSC